MSILNQTKILIIDDHEDIREYLAMILEDNISCTIFEADNGARGLEIIEKFPVDIVISDLHMPKMSGFEIAEHISKKRPEILTILITGNTDLDALREAIKYKVYDFIEKPFNEENLLIRIKNAVGVIQEKKITDMLSREAIIQVYGFENPEDFDELTHEEKDSLRTRVITMISQSYERK